MSCINSGATFCISCAITPELSAPVSFLVKLTPLISKTFLPFKVFMFFFNFLSEKAITSAAPVIVEPANIFLAILAPPSHLSAPVSPLLLVESVVFVMSITPLKVLVPV